MSIRQCPTATLTAISAFITAQAANLANPQALAINPPGQLNASTGSVISSATSSASAAIVAAAINRGARTITMAGGARPV